MDDDLSLLEFLFFSFLSPFSLIEFLREETPFVLLLLLLLLFFVLLLLLLFFDGDLLLLAVAAVAVLALGFSPARTFLTASLVSVWLSISFDKAWRKSLVLSGS